MGAGTSIEELAHWRNFWDLARKYLHPVELRLLFFAFCNKRDALTCSDVFVREEYTLRGRNYPYAIPFVDYIAPMIGQGFALESWLVRPEFELALANVGRDGTNGQAIRRRWFHSRGHDYTGSVEDMNKDKCLMLVRNGHMPLAPSHVRWLIRNQPLVLMAEIYVKYHPLVGSWIVRAIAEYGLCEKFDAMVGRKLSYPVMFVSRLAMLDGTLQECIDAYQARAIALGADPALENVAVSWERLICRDLVKYGRHDLMREYLQRYSSIHLYTMIQKNKASVETVKILCETMGDNECGTMTWLIQVCMHGNNHEYMNAMMPYYIAHAKICTHGHTPKLLDTRHPKIIAMTNNAHLFMPAWEVRAINHASTVIDSVANWIPTIYVVGLIALPFMLAAWKKA